MILASSLFLTPHIRSISKRLPVLQLKYILNLSSFLSPLLPPKFISCLDLGNNLLLASFLYFYLTVVHSVQSKQHDHPCHALD